MSGLERLRMYGSELVRHVPTVSVWYTKFARLQSTWQCRKTNPQQVNRLTTHSLVHGEGECMLIVKGVVGYMRS